MKKQLKKVLLVLEKIEEETEKAIFIYYHGHVSLLDIDIAKTKENYDDKICSFRVYLDWESAENELEKLIPELETIYKEALHESN